MDFCLRFFQVSWIRHDNLEILTAGRYTYTSDQRYEALNPEESTDWILRIRNTQLKDSGRYECQVSTQPIRSFFFNLRVVGE